MMRNFYHTSTGRPYQYGTTGTSTTDASPVGSNQIRYPPTSVAYSQFSPLTAGIRQVLIFDPEIFAKKTNLLFLYF
jgi:hypothetical protein